MVGAVEKLPIRRMGVQVHWAPSLIFREMVAKRATLSWAEVEAMALVVLACTKLSRVSEAITIRRKEQGVCSFRGQEQSGMARAAGGSMGRAMARVPALGKAAAHGQDGRTRAGRSTTEISGRCKSWKSISSFWWHKYHGRKCDGIAYDDSGQPGYGPAAAGGALCSWQGVGKAQQWRSTMPPQGIPGFMKNGAHSQSHFTKGMP